MEPHDRTAMQAAIEELLRLEPDWQETIAGMLMRQPWEEVGLFAAICCQTRALRLRAHECAPAETHNVAEPSNHYSFRPSEVRLLKRVLSLGVSRFAPDPMRAIAAAEAKQHAA
jgi:hypothetical protein